MQRRVTTTSNSQPEKLAARMNEAGMRHGDVARATLPNVAIHRTGNRIFSRFEARFCSLGSLENVRVLEHGDGSSLPSHAVIEGCRIAEPGYYKVHDALVTSNGNMVVRVDAQTRFEKLHGLAHI